jgi:hypothetical protein
MEPSAKISIFWNVKRGILSEFSGVPDARSSPTSRVEQ